MSRKETIIADIRRVADFLATIDPNDFEQFDYDYYNEFLRSRIPLLPFLSKIPEIMQTLDRLVERSREGERFPTVQCRFAGSAGDNILQLLTGPRSNTSRPEALQYLNKCLSGTKHLTICDPYFLTKPPGLTADEYVRAIEGVIPNTVNHLDLFSGKRKRHTEVASKINDWCRNRKIRVKAWKTDEIHDRVWIKDFHSAYVVGTSFNGLGDKCAFILSLQEEDRRDFIRAITTLRDDLPESRSL
jgi:hypothetical protein